MMLTRPLSKSVTLVVGIECILDLVQSIKMGYLETFLFVTSPGSVKCWESLMIEIRNRTRFIVDANDYVHVYVKFDN